MTRKQSGKSEGRDRRIRELEERIKYLQAEFENYRKALDRQRESLENEVAASLVRDLLPFLDDLESAAEKAGSKEARKGYEAMLSKLLSILSSRGLKRIDALGKRFDPYFHEAVSVIESESPDGTVVKEFQKGYTFNSVVIRHSKVGIARRKKSDSRKEGDQHG